MKVILIGLSDFVIDEIISKEPSISLDFKIHSGMIYKYLVGEN